MSLSLNESVDERQLESEALILRNGIFLAASRTYGETYMEPVLRKILKLVKPSSGDHDGVDSITQDRYEIKCSKVLLARSKNQNKSVTDFSLFDVISEGAKSDPLNRIVSFYDRKKVKYDANIQNVKRDHFEYLVYVLMFAERIQVFKIATKDVNKTTIPAWSDKHGRYDAPGKSGQFNIKCDNIEEHERNHFHKSFTWEELVPFYKEIDAKNGN